jgi:hypothetical protein
MKPPIVITHMSPLTIWVPMSWHVVMHFEFITKIKFPKVPLEVPTRKCAHTQVVLNMGTTIAFEATFTLFPSPNQWPQLQVLLQLYQQHSKLLMSNKEVTILVP